MCEWCREQGYCTLYGTAGHRADKDALDRPNNTRAQAVAGDVYRTLQEVCPQLTAENGGATGRYCCDDRQIHDLFTKVALLVSEYPFASTCSENVRHAGAAAAGGA